MVMVGLLEKYFKTHFDQWKPSPLHLQIVNSLILEESNFRMGDLNTCGIKC